MSYLNRNVHRIAAMVVAMFGVGMSVATGEQIKSAEHEVKLANVNSNGSRGVGPWATRTPGWRQKQRRKLARRRGR